MIRAERDQRYDEYQCGQAAFPAHGQTTELMQQREGLLDHVAQLAQALDAGHLWFRDDRLDR